MNLQQENTPCDEEEQSEDPMESPKYNQINYTVKLRMARYVSYRLFDSTLLHRYMLQVRG